MHFYNFFFSCRYPNDFINSLFLEVAEPGSWRAGKAAVASVGATKGVQRVPSVSWDPLPTHRKQGHYV